MSITIYTVLAFVVYLIYYLFIAKDGYGAGLYLFTLPTLFVLIKLFRISSILMRFILVGYLLLLYVLSVFLAHNGSVAPWEVVAFVDLLFLFSFLFNQNENDTPLAIDSLWKYHLFIILFALSAGSLSFYLQHDVMHALFTTASLLSPVVLMVTLMGFVSSIIKTTAVSVVLKNYKFFLQGGQISRLIFADEKMLQQEQFELSEVVTEDGFDQALFFAKVEQLNGQSAHSAEFQDALKNDTVFSYDFDGVILAMATVKAFLNSDEYRFSEKLATPNTSQEGMRFVGLAENGIVLGYYAVEKIGSKQNWEKLSLIRDGLHKDVLFAKGCKKAENEGYPLININDFSYEKGDLLIAFSAISVPHSVVVAGVNEFKEGVDMYFNTPFVDTVLRLVAVTNNLSALLVRAMMYAFVPVALNVWILFLGLRLPQMGGIVLLLSFAIALLYMFSGKGAAAIVQK